MMTLPDNLDLTHLGSFDKSLKWAGNGGSAGEGRGPPGPGANMAPLPARD